MRRGPRQIGGVEVAQGADAQDPGARSQEARRSAYPPVAWACETLVSITRQTQPGLRQAERHRAAELRSRQSR